MKIKTAGDLRSFLADVMVGIKNGNVEPEQASAISKVAAQINNSLSVEVNTALRLASMGQGHPIAGSMLIGSADPERQALPEPDADGMIWCAQCDARVTEEDALGCKSKRCTVKGLA